MSATDELATATADRASGLMAQRLHDAAELAALAPEWQALWRRCPDATPFQSPDWLVPWWRAYGEGELLAWAFRRDGRLVGLAPLYWSATCGRVFLLGSGNSDYLGMLCEPDAAADAAAILLRLLRVGRPGALVECQQLRDGSPLLGAPAPDAAHDETAAQEPCPVLDLRAGTPVAGSALWRHAAYCRRRLGALGQVEAVLAGPEDFEEVFAALVRLHGERWATRGLPGVLAAERDRRFHRDAARSLLQAGCLRLQAIRLDGRIVAVLYGFFAQGRSYYYLSGFASELAGLSLGTQLVAGAVEQAMRDGACEFDFLRGCESYKYRWGAVDRACYVRRIRFASGKPAACNAGTQPPPGMLTG